MLRFLSLLLALLCLFSLSACSSSSPSSDTSSLPDSFSVVDSDLVAHTPPAGFIDGYNEFDPSLLDADFSSLSFDDQKIFFIGFVTDVVSTDDAIYYIYITDDFGNIWHANFGSEAIGDYYESSSYDDFSALVGDRVWVTGLFDGNMVDKGFVAFSLSSCFSVLHGDVLSGIGLHYESINSNYSDSDSFVATDSFDSDTSISSALSQKNALASALGYLMISPFSFDGLVAQLEYEQYPHDDAVWAAENCGADWYDQALQSAKHYLETFPFSYSGLREQLEFEKFTSEQAAYGVDNCGADWMDQAAKKAKSYLDSMSFSRQELIDQLMFDGFSEAEALYGVEAVGY